MPEDGVPPTINPGVPQNTNAGVPPTANLGVPPEVQPKKSLSKKNLILLVIVGLVVVLGIAGYLMTKKDDTQTTQAPPPTPPVAIIQMTKTGPQPVSITVKKGAKVTWKGEDTIHTISASPSLDNSQAAALFNNQEISTGKDYSFVFDTVGEYSYRDQIKETETIINGTVIVVE